MLAKKTVIGVRTNKFDDQVQSLVEYLLRFFSIDDVFMVVDETKYVVDIPESMQKVSLDTAFMQDNALFYDHPKITWLCGDYFYYCLHKKVDANFYWLIEPDVLINYKSPSRFFKAFESNPSDALLHRFAEADDEWWWAKKGKVIADNVYQCLFPITRLSRHAVKSLMSKRIELSSLFNSTQIASSAYPNDEVFVATTLVLHGLKVENMSETLKGSFIHCTYDGFVSLELVERGYLNNQVLHPLKQPDFFLSRLQNYVSERLINDPVFIRLLNEIPFNQDITATIVDKLHSQLQSDILGLLKQKVVRRDYFYALLRWLEKSPALYKRRKAFFYLQPNSVRVSLQLRSYWYSIFYVWFDDYIECYVQIESEGVNVALPRKCLNKRAGDEAKFVLCRDELRTLDHDLKLLEESLLQIVKVFVQ